MSLVDPPRPYLDGLSTDIEPAVSAEPSFSSHPYLLWESSEEAGLRTKAADTTTPNGNAWSSEDIYSAVKTGLDEHLGGSGLGPHGIIAGSLVYMIEGNSSSYAADVYSALNSLRNDPDWEGNQPNEYLSNSVASKPCIQYAIGYDAIHAYLVANHSGQLQSLRNRLALECARLYDALHNEGKVDGYSSWGLWKAYLTGHHLHALTALTLGSFALKNSEDKDHITQTYDNSAKGGFVGSGASGTITGADIDTFRAFAKAEAARRHYAYQTLTDGVGQEGSYYSDFLGLNLECILFYVLKRFNFDLISVSRHHQKRLAWLVYNTRLTSQANEFFFPHGDIATSFVQRNGSMFPCRLLAAELLAANPARAPVCEAALWLADQIATKNTDLPGSAITNGRQALIASNEFNNAAIPFEFLAYDKSLSPVSPDAQSTKWPKWAFFDSRGILLVRRDGWAESGVSIGMTCGTPWSRGHHDYLLNFMSWDPNAASGGGQLRGQWDNLTAGRNSHPDYAAQSDPANGDPGFPNDTRGDYGGHAHCDAGIVQAYDCDQDHYLMISAHGKRPDLEVEQRQGRDPYGQLTISVNDASYGPDGQNSMRSEEYGGSNEDFGGTSPKDWRSDVFNLRDLWHATRGENPRIPFTHMTFAKAYHRNVQNAPNAFAPVYPVHRAERYVFSNLARKMTLWIDVLRKDDGGVVYGWHGTSFQLASRSGAYIQAPIAPGRDMAYHVVTPSSWTFGTKSWPPSVSNNRTIDPFGNDRIHGFRIKSDNTSSGTERRFIVAAQPTSDFDNSKLSASTSVDDGDLTGVQVDYSDGTDLYLLNHSHATAPGEGAVSFTAGGGPYNLNGRAAGLVFGAVGTTLSDLTELLIVQGEFLGIEGGVTLISAPNLISSMHVLIGGTTGSTDIDVSGRGFGMQDIAIYIGTGRTINTVDVNGTAYPDYSYDSGTGVLTLLDASPPPEPATNNERRSSASFSLHPIFSSPDGMIGKADRKQVLGVYSQIATAEPPPPGPPPPTPSGSFIFDAAHVLKAVYDAQNNTLRVHYQGAPSAEVGSHRLDEWQVWKSIFDETTGKLRTVR